uniref:Uncharacterized protein n=1 Tax=Rhizophora mucronata TaxID=61149 RepID=A0A2P2PSR8_RHIMU
MLQLVIFSSLCLTLQKVNNRVLHVCLVINKIEQQLIHVT